MVKKMGRPTESPKTNQTRIRMSDEDLELLDFCCEKTGLSKADIIRLGIKKVYEELKK
jgi:predicted DNA-binding protein